MVVKRKIKNSPRYIIFWAVSNYLTESELELLIQDFIKGKGINHPRFLSIIKKHFDFERFRTHPVFWQDIWLYNYLMYDVKDNRLIRNQLIADYDRYILKPTSKITAEMRSFLS